MSNKSGGFSKGLERGVFWIAGTMLVGAALYSGFSKLEADDAIASEKEVVALDASRLVASENLDEQTTGTTIDSILSDSDVLCLVALNDSANTSISVTERSSIHANGCGVHSNARTEKNSAVLIDLDAELATPVIHSNGAVPGLSLIHI